MGEPQQRGASIFSRQLSSFANLRRDRLKNRFGGGWPNHANSTSIFARPWMADNELYVQFGCGLSAPDGWLNFDASPTLRIQRIPGLGGLLKSSTAYPRFPPGVRYGDIVRGLPLRPGSCEAMYCSHVLEHLSLEDLRVALRNTATYLRPGGRFRLVVPDLEQLCRDYLASSQTDAASTFMEHAHLGVRTRQRGPGGLLRTWLGNSAHLWMWDYKSLAAELNAAGFTSIRRAQIGDCNDPRFTDVEDEGRWAGCLGIECFSKAPVPSSTS